MEHWAAEPTGADPPPVVVVDPCAAFWPGLHRGLNDSHHRPDPTACVASATAGPRTSGQRSFVASRGKRSSTRAGAFRRAPRSQSENGTSGRSRFNSATSAA